MSGKAKETGLLDTVKGWLETLHLDVGIGSGFNLSRMVKGDFKPIPYLHISMLRGNNLGLGAVLTSLKDLGITAGVKVTPKRDKMQIWVDAGATCPADKLREIGKNLDIFAGFRVRF